MGICWDTKGNVWFATSRPVGTEVTQTTPGKHGYKQDKFTPGMWKYHTHSNQFCLVVKYFGVQYQGWQHVDHLKQTLEQTYEISTKWTGSKYVGLTVQWAYKNHAVQMLGYVQKALTWFQHPNPKWPQYQPHPNVPHKYGQKQQFFKPEDKTIPLDEKKTKFIQEVTSMVLFCAQAINSTMLTSLSAIASEQANPTEQMFKWTKQFLDYATNNEAVVAYHASNMILAVHSDDSYLSEPKACSQAGGHFILSADMMFPPNNGVILNTAEIIKNIMLSAAEAEFGALYINSKLAMQIQHTLTSMGHPWSPKPMQTDNSTVYGVNSNKIICKVTKAMDMHFYWLRGCKQQQQIWFY